MKLSETAAAIRCGELSSRDLASEYITKIENNRRLNAIIEINPDAYAEAGRLDASDTKTGALYGVPILLKDNINTGDRMHTSAGSVALSDNIAPGDAPLVRRLREAGALLLGKTNMTEFANYMTDGKMPNGYSSRGGQTLNFYDPKADPSGSSTGSAVAVTAGLCASAIGTETSGSIISPAQHAGVVGIKPTIGLIDNGGILPISLTLDTPGPLARCAEDAGLLLGVMAGKEYGDIRAGGAGRLAGIRVGVVRKTDDDTDEADTEARERLIGVMRDLGAECVDLPVIDINAVEIIRKIALYEFKYGINLYLRSMRNPAIPQSLREIIEYNERHPQIALRYGQDNLVDADVSAVGDLSEPEYMEALSARREGIKNLNAYFDDNRIDVFYSISTNSALAAATGFPSMTIPIGMSPKALPVGSFFITRRYSENVLLKMAAEIETSLNAG